LISPPKVSVVIPTYNYAQFISQAIDSVLNQTFTDYEIIVIDDGSSDRTLENLQTYGHKICYVTQSNQGLVAARNRGIKLARGELIVFLDADDWFHPQMLENSVAIFAAQPELGMVVSGWQIVDEIRQTISELKPWQSFPQLDLSTWVVWRPLLPSATLFRREWLNNVGGFDAEIFPAEDIDCVLRMAALGCQSAWNKKIGVYYRRHQQSITQNTLRQAQAFEKLCDRFFGRKDLAWEIRQLENQTRFYCLVWSAWRLHITGHDQQMLNYLAKSCHYSTELPTATIAEWGKYFARDCLDFLGQSFDVYRVGELPGWSELVVSVMNNVIPKISVVIPVYNSASSLPEAIASVLAQTYSHYELIVVDDGSNDNILEVLNPYLSQIRYVKQDHQGAAATRNRGLHLARGEFIIFLDAAERFYPTMLESQINTLSTTQDWGMIISGWQISDRTGINISAVKIWSYLPENNLANLLCWKPFSLSATLFYRPWLEKVAGFSGVIIGRFAIDCFMRLVAAGCPVAFCSNIGVEYRQKKVDLAFQEQTFQLVHQNFFGLPDLEQKVRQLESQVCFAALVDSAWRCYCAGNMVLMLSYLEASQEYITRSGGEAIEQWLQTFVYRSGELNYQLNSYGLTQIPEWQELITRTLGINLPVVSVIIPVYNNAQYLSLAIASVLAQTYTDYEVIVIDDGSTDNIAEVISPYLDKIRYVKQSNQGVSSARNRGLNLARGKLIAFLDADDIFLPQKLALQVEVFNTQPQVGIVNSGFEVIQADGNIVTEVRWWEDIPKLDEIAWVLYKPILPSAMMFRRQWLHKIGGFDPRFFAGEDIYLTLCIISQGCSAAWLTEVTTQYRRHQQSVTLNNPLQQLHNTELMIKTFFSQEDLPQSIKDLESESLFSIFTWMATRCYQASLYSEMKEYLLKSRQYSHHLSWVAMTEQWVQIFYKSIEAFGETFDAYQLSSLSEWSKVIQSQQSKTLETRY